MDVTSVMPPSDSTALPPSIFKKIIELNLVDGIMCPPHTIVQIYNNPETQSLLKSLEYVLYLGAALDQAIGDDLCEHTRLTALIGSTETGPHMSLTPVDKKLWNTFDFIPESVHRMVRIEGSGSIGGGSDDLYELVLEKPVAAESLYKSTFWNPMYKNEDRVETKELYAPVKDKDGRTRWRMTARKDDLTKLSWLAKFHAKDIESRILQHRDVSAVFVGGEGRPTPYMIVEPREGVLDDKSADTLLDELYSSVVMRTNEVDIKEIGIPKETVLIARKEVPFKRSSKQTLMRKEIEKDYAEEIEKAYIRLEKSKA